MVVRKYYNRQPKRCRTIKLLLATEKAEGIHQPGRVRTATSPNPLPPKTGRPLPHYGPSPVVATAIATTIVAAHFTHPHVRRLVQRQPRTLPPPGSSGGILKEPSAALSILWMRRTLSFQNSFFEELSKTTPEQSDAPARAALTAYHRTLEPYHSNLLRKVYRIGLPRGMPDRQTLLAKFGGSERTIGDMRKLVQVWRPLLKSMERPFLALDLEDTRRV